MKPHFSHTAADADFSQLSVRFLPGYSSFVWIVQFLGRSELPSCLGLSSKIFCASPEGIGCVTVIIGFLKE